MKNNHIIRSILSLVTITLILGIASAAFADDPLKATAWAWPPSGNNNTNTGLVGPVQINSTVENAYAEASADYGILKLYGEAHRVGGSGSTGYATAEWNDVLTFNSDTLDGQTGHATLHYQIDGSFNVGLSGGTSDYAKFYLDVTTRDTAHYYDSLAEDNPYFGYYGNGSLDNPNFLNAPRTLEISFTYGVPLELRFWVQIQTAALWDNGSYAIADLSHTATWGGITDIEDSLGDPVEDYSLSSDSGTDYLNPIPEPSTTALLLGAGVFVVALSRRRFRKE